MLLPRDDSKEASRLPKRWPARLRNGCGIAGDPPCRRVANGAPATGAGRVRRWPTAGCRGRPRPLWDSSIYDQLSAYARQRQKHALARVTIEKRSSGLFRRARSAGAASGADRGLGTAGCLPPQYALIRSQRRSMAAVSLRVVAGNGARGLGRASPGQGLCASIRAAKGRSAAAAVRCGMMGTDGMSSALRLQRPLKDDGSAPSVSWDRLSALPSLAVRGPRAALGRRDRLAIPDGFKIKMSWPICSDLRCARGQPDPDRSKWAFRTADDLGYLLSKEIEEPRKLSRALSKPCRSSPITSRHTGGNRGDPRRRHRQGHARCLVETGWIRMRGRRKTPGRPITSGRPRRSLAFHLSAIADLPGLEELKAQAMIEGRVPQQLLIPLPSDDEPRCVRMRTRWMAIRFCSRRKSASTKPTSR